MACTDSDVKPIEGGARSVPRESDKERTVEPSEMSLRAANWATLPEPEIATRVDGEVKERLGVDLANIYMRVIRHVRE